MKIAIAEDVLLDILMKRHPAYDSSSELLDLIGNEKAEGFIMLPTLISIYRIAKERVGPDKAKQIVSEIAFVLKVLPVPDAERYLSAFNGKSDIENMMLIASSECASIDHIASNDTKGFKNTKVPAKTPKDLCAMIKK